MPEYPLLGFVVASELPKRHRMGWGNDTSPETGTMSLGLATRETAVGHWQCTPDHDMSKVLRWRNK